MRKTTFLSVSCALVISAVSFAVPAASFDCSKAGTAMEKAICGTPAINRLDGEVGRLYTRLLGEFSPSAKSGLKADQRAWVGTRDARCNAAASGAKSTFFDCAEPIYQRRINHLRAELGEPHRSDYPSNGDSKLCGGCEFSGPDAAMGCAGYTTRSGCVASKHCAWVVKHCP